MSRPLILVCTLMLLLGATGPPATAAVGVGDPAPNFFVENIQDGSFFQLAEFRGKVVVLVFFAYG